jgi:formamidopyrimidine-DNA glycosylase
VETIRRTLEPAVLGRRIAAVQVHHPHAVEPLSPRNFAAAVVGRSVARLWRKGKYLVFDLAADGGARPGGPSAPLALVVHLRMTGRLCYVPPGRRWGEDPAHTHATLRLAGGGRLVFHDVRKFGRLTLAAPADLLRLLPPGRDPVTDGLSATDLRALFGGRAASLKALLLRQDLLCGIGNIYADEALHRAGLHPARTPAELAPEDWEALAAGIAAVLREALAFRGTTLLDYRTGDGEPGSFAEYLRVYGRAGLPCRACGTAVRSVRLGGRTTAFCPRCQPPPPRLAPPRPGAV